MKLKHVLLAILLITGVAFAQNEFKKEIDVRPGQKLRVDINSGGSIDVLGWDDSRIEVRADIRRYDPEKYHIEIDRHDDGVDIEAFDAFGNNRNIHFKIRVPYEFDLNLETMGGDIRIENVQGVIDGQTLGGNLDFIKLNGEIHMTTMGGDIDMRDSQLAGDIKTMGGDINFYNVSGDMKGTTMGGDITLRSSISFSAQDKKSKVNINTMGGDIYVESAPKGAEVSTMGGDIDIRSAGIFVKAKTMGGDIEVQKVNGEIRASTMGGDVVVNVTGVSDDIHRDVDLSSMGGEIKLSLPERFSADFRVKLTYTRNSSQDFKIESDFPLNIEESDEWNYDHGTPRKYIFGTGKINDGKFDVQLETINGNIIIRKGR